MKQLRIGWIFFICVSIILPATGFSYDSGHYSIVLKGTKAWNAMKTGLPETRFDLSGADLKGKNLKGIDFSNVNLDGASLKGADVSDADLRGASLNGAFLRNALFYDALFRDASLRNADIEEASLDGADLRRAVLDGAVLKQADLANSLLREASLRGVDLRAASLRAADLAGSNLDGAYLWRADLDGANLEGTHVTSVTVVETGKYADRAWADKHGALLSLPEPGAAGHEIEKNDGVEKRNSEAGQVPAEKNDAGIPNSEKHAAVSGTESKGRDTAAVALDRSWPVNPVQQKIRFGVTRSDVGALSYDVHQRELLVDSVSRWNKMRKKNPAEPVRLAGARLSRKVLDGADLRNADLKGTLLKRTDLVDADLRGADLREANLREADLTNADLQGADLRGAYLWRANLSWTVLNGVIVDAQTVLGTGRKATPAWAEKAGAVYRHPE